MPRYKATAIGSQSVPQHVYGTNPEKVAAKAVALLTYFQPGFAGSFPVEVVLQRSLGRVSGNRSSWKVVRRIPFAEIPADQHEWIRRKLKSLLTNPAPGPILSSP